MTHIWFFLSLVVSFIDPRYHTYDEAVAEIDSLVAQYTAITRLDTICLSTRDSLLVLAVKISDNPNINEDEPALLYNGIHHGEELLGGEVCFYLLNDLLSKYNIDTLITRWINESEIWIVPILNPEGQTVVMTGIDTIWRKNKRDNNNNGFFDTDSDGVDLNRNYDFNWELGGSNDPTSEYFRGAAPFSENETRGIRDLSFEEHFLFDVCYHNVRTGQGELVYFPWRWDAQFCIDYEFIKKVADTLASKIINDAGTASYVPIYGYATEGTARNWHYGVNGTFAFTIEVSRSCYPPGNLVDSICIRNLVGAHYLFERAFGSSITGIITDSMTNLPLVAEARIAGYYDSILVPRQSESVYGRYRRIVNAGTYSLTFLRNGYETMTFSNVVVQPGVPTILNVKMVPLAVEETAGQAAVCESSLEVYPNPFLRSAQIKFQIPSTKFQANFNSQNSLKIFDATGRLVKSFSLPTTYSAMQYGGLLSTVAWYGNDDDGRRLPPGVYFVCLESRDAMKIRKTVLLR